MPWLDECSLEIDKFYGHGYSKEHPEILIGYVKACIIGNALENIGIELNNINQTLPGLTISDTVAEGLKSIAIATAQRKK